MKIRIVVLAVLILIASSFIAGCSKSNTSTESNSPNNSAAIEKTNITANNSFSNSSNGNKSGEKDAAGMTRTQVFHAAINAAAEGNYTQANKYIKFVNASVEETKDRWTNLMEFEFKGSINNVEIIGESLHESDNACIDYRVLDPKTGNYQSRVWARFDKVNGCWKIVEFNERYFD